MLTATAGCGASPVICEAAFDETARALTAVLTTRSVAARPRSTLRERCATRSEIGRAAAAIATAAEACCKRRIGHRRLRGRVLLRLRGHLRRRCIVRAIRTDRHAREEEGDDRGGRRHADAAPADATATGGATRGHCRDGDFIAQRIAHALGEGQRQRRTLPAQRIADALPAIAGGAPVLVVVEALERETRDVADEFAVEQRAQRFAIGVEMIVCGGRVHRVARSRFGSVSSTGRSSASIASRARKIRERTVPIGHCIRSAMSS